MRRTPQPSAVHLSLLGALILATGACEDVPVTGVDTLTPVFDFVDAGDIRLGDGAVEQEQIELCKVGMDATFTVDVINHTTSGTRETLSYDVDVADGECLLIWESGGPFVDTVTVTEQVPSGYSASWEVTQLSGGSTTSTSGVGPQAEAYTAGSTAGPITNAGALIVFTNTPSGETGRMTGGGGQIRVDGVRITRGFTIHCDITLSNNLEINWSGGNKWHIDKPLTSALCVDDPAYDQTPPPAPFNTFHGEGVGSLNGVDGSWVHFTFIDDGEPGVGDIASIQVWAPGDDPNIDVPVLSVSGYLDHGNIQAHYDQPHS